MAPGVGRRSEPANRDRIEDPYSKIRVVPGAETPGLESTHVLLERARAGDTLALDILLSRYRPRLRRWAHRRLPVWARGVADTDDLVQNTFIKAIRNLDQFVLDGAEGFQNYLRLAIGNAIRDEVRRTRRQPPAAALDVSLPSEHPSPLDHAIVSRRLDRYEAALAQLTAEEREAVIARLEFGFTHGELAAALGKQTPDAARKACRKAIARLVALMDDARS